MTTYNGFTPAQNGTIAVTTKSDAINIGGTGGSVTVRNLGTAEVFVALGSSTVTATAGQTAASKASDGSFAVASGERVTLVTAPSDGYVAAITASGTATLRVSRGEGKP